MAAPFSQDCSHFPSTCVSIQTKQGNDVTQDLAICAEERGIKYFMITYTDLLARSAPSWCPPQQSPTCRRTVRVLQALPHGST